MKITIHRGTHEIGGTCIELVANNGKRLWIDLGLPLSSKNPDIGYARKNPPDALLISHPHQDHFGLMDCVGTQTPIHIGSVSLDLINASRLFLRKPPVQGTFKLFSAWKWFTVADVFRVKPLLVDHSSPEAFAFLIEVDGKRIFYSGDFRTTGYKKKVYYNLIARPPKDIDLLLIEGTMADRSNTKYADEEMVQRAICKIVKMQKNVTFVISSAQNIDRYMSVVNACEKSGRQVVVDVYNAWVLDMVKRKFPGLPDIDWKGVRVYDKDSQMETIESPEFEGFRKRIARKKIGNEIFRTPKEFVYFLRCPNVHLINRLRPHGIINVIYSQWEGYLLPEHATCYTPIFNALKNDPGICFTPIHTSGHATLDKLIELSRAISPGKIVPIHTEYPDKIRGAFEKEGLNMVDLWDDGQGYKL